MRAAAINHQNTIVRPVVETDLNNILRLINSARRVYLRVAPDSLKGKIKTVSGFLAEDQVGLRGFMLIEPQHPVTALIMAAALRDTWGLGPYLDTLLPEIEGIAQDKELSTLAHIGHDDWLVDVLRERGFETRGWIIAFERFGDWPASIVAMPALVRTAHLNDLPAILALDSLTFDQLWRKPADSFNEAMAKAVSFVVAELDGQIVGYEWCEIYHRHAHLARLAVHPDYQGRGIGAQLLYQAIIDSLTRGVKLITLNTQEDNYRSHALYERFGFVQTGQRIPVLGKALG